MVDASDFQSAESREAMLQILTDALYLADDPDLDREAMNLGWRAMAVVHQRLRGEGGQDDG